MMNYDIQKLRQRKAERGLTDSALLRLINQGPADEHLSRATIYRIFDVERGSPESVSIVAKALGLSLKEITRKDAR